MLQGSDLPDDPHGYDGVVDTAGWDVRDAFPSTPLRRSRLRTVVSLVAAVLVALAVAVAVWVSTAATGHNSRLTAAVAIGVPAALLVLAVLLNLAGRRRHH